MRKAYLKKYSAGYIKGSPSKQRANRGSAYRLAEALRERAKELGHGERTALLKNEKGEIYQQLEIWIPGPNPRVKAQEKLYDNELSKLYLFQTSRHQKRQHYNKVVLKSSPESTVTMYFCGMEVFLIEDYPDGTFRQSLQSASTTHMKNLFKMNRVPWLEVGEGNV